MIYLTLAARQWPIEKLIGAAGYPSAGREEEGQSDNPLLWKPTRQSGLERLAQATSRARAAERTFWKESSAGLYLLR